MAVLNFDQIAQAVQLPKEKIVNELYNKSSITEFCKYNEEKSDDADNKEDEIDWYLIGTFVGLGIVIALLVIIIIIFRIRMKKKNVDEPIDDNDPLLRDTKMTTE